MSDRSFVQRLIRIGGELTLIVAGVAIALAAEDWRQEREAASEARATAELMLEELKLDSANLAVLYSYLPRRDTAAAVLLSSALRPEFPTDSALQALWTLRFHTAYSPSRAAFERLIQSEGLRHIGAPELQRDIVTYYQTGQGEVVELYQYFNRHQDWFAEASFPHVGITPADFEQGLGDQADMDHIAITSWEVMRNDPVLMNRIWYIKAASRVLQHYVQPTQELNARVRGALARELGAER